MTASVRAPNPARIRRAPAAVLEITSEAAGQIKAIMKEQPKMNGLRISVRTAGCSGNAFHFEYAEEKKKLDEEVDAEGTKVWIDSKAIMKILGSTMDYVEDDLTSEFVFENPNVKGACGCGESWHV